MDGLKRALRNLFNRDRKDKKQAQKKSAPATSQQQQQKPRQPPQKPPLTTGTKQQPPQLPPIQDSSPVRTTQEAPKKHIPPTHALVTGRHRKPQEAVPQNHAAKPGPAAAYLTPASASATGRIKGLRGIGAEEGASARDVSLVDLGDHAEDARRSDAVSSLDSQSEGASTVERSPRLEQKRARAVEPSTMEQSRVVNTSEPQSRSHEPTSPIATSKRQVEQPNGATSPASTSTRTFTNGDTPATCTTSAASPAVPDYSEKMLAPAPDYSEKMLAGDMDEAQPLKTLDVVPGMSATSGPLEDFPQDIEMRYH